MTLILLIFTSFLKSQGPGVFHKFSTNASLRRYQNAEPQPMEEF